MSMKKNVFGLAAMAVAVSMASCSLEEVMEQPAQQAIGFSTFVGKSTKAATELIKPDGTAETGQAALTKFYVFGKYGAKDGASYDAEVYSNAEVSVTSSNFTNVGPTELKYWVANKDYIFAAYSNGNKKIESNVSFGTDGHITFHDYTAGEKDLILAIAEKTTGTTIDNDPGAVGLEFKHLLSQVAFEFKNGFTNGYKVKITELKFSVNNKATYFYQISDYGWETPTDAAYKEYAIYGGNPFDGDQNSTQTSESNFVIPQTNTDIKASFTVTVYDTDGTTQIAEKKYADDNAVSLATGTTTTLGSDNTWTPGYKYKYTATINADVLDDVMFPIKFTVTSVDTWKDAEGNFDLFN